jgi:catechol 2,3-dioxygenase-like lactoylglutathione lyase family enzyme
MRLAKPAVDIGLSTERLDEMLAFWQAQPGVRFDHVLETGPGARQHRHDVGGSVLKINQSAAPIPAAPLSGYRELIIACDVDAPVSRTDPDGDLLRLAPKGFEGIRQIAVRMAVRDLAAHRRFYAEALGLPEEAPGRFRAGETLMILEESPDAPSDAGVSGPGWRYITLQVFKVDEAHANAIAHGAREGRPPTRLGDVAKFSMIRDPDGNWIELSQRAELVGSLD